jgi:hypothetical protein
MNNRYPESKSSPGLAMLLILALLLSACQFGGGAKAPDGENQEDQQGTASPSDEAGGEGAEQTPPPADIFDLVEQQIEAGDDAGAVIVDNLRILVGEATTTEVYGGLEVVLEGSWGLFSLAADYLAAGEDEAIKEEIRRLVSILAPPQENLDAYAEATSASLGHPSARPVVDHASYQDECQSLWHEGFPLNVNPKPLCLLYQEGATGPGHSYKLYYPKEWENDLGKLDLVISASQALQESASKYQALGFQVESMMVVFTLLQSEANALAVNPAMADPCPILILPESHSLAEGEFKQTIAHEVFHCVTYHHFGQTEYATTKWWEESGAEFFSNVVYPDVNIEHKTHWVFDWYSLTTPILNMSYPNSVFLQYLENVGGTSLVLELMEAMPKTGTKHQQAEALHNFPNFEQLFHEFGKAYADGQITDTGGGIGSTPKPAIPITVSGQALLVTPAFTLTRYRILLPEGYEYAISGTQDGEGLVSAKPSLQSLDWGPMPATVNSACEEGPFSLLMTSTLPVSGDTYSLDISASQGEEVGCDKCLLGHWLLDVDSQARPFFEAKFGEAGLELDNVSGTWEMFFHSDGSWSHIATDYGVTVTQPSDFATTEVLVTMYGVLFGRFGVDKDHTIITLWDFHPLMEVNTIVYINGEELGMSNMPLDAAFMGDAMTVDQRQYTCTETSLTIYYPPFFAPVTQVVFTRQ